MTQVYIPDIDLNEIPVDDVIEEEEVKNWQKNYFVIVTGSILPVPGMRTFYVIWKNKEIGISRS